RANRRSHRTRAHRTTAGRMLQAGVSPKDREHRWNDASANRAGLLEFIRALRAQKPGTLALDVQTLALPSCTSRSTLPVLLQLLSAVRRHGGSQQGWRERQSEVVEALPRRTPAISRQRSVTFVSNRLFLRFKLAIQQPGE